MNSVLTGDQLWFKWIYDEPWCGHDPRFLTRGHSVVSLSSEGTGRPNRIVSEAVQVELFPEGTPYA